MFSYYHATPPLSPMRVMAVGHGSWVTWVMGQLCDESHGSRVTKNDPFPALSVTIYTNGHRCTFNALSSYYENTSVGPTAKQHINTTPLVV